VDRRETRRSKQFFKVNSAQGEDIVSWGATPPGYIPEQ